MNSFIFTSLFELSKYPWIADLALFLSYPFAYGILILLFVWAVFFESRKMLTFSLLFLSIISTWFLSSILKLIFHTPRPFVELGLVPLYIEKSFSFPSSHSAIFASTAFVLFFMNKKLGIVFMVIALLVGLSRIVIGVHYPIDVVGGFCFGIIIGYLFIKIFKKI